MSPRPIANYAPPTFQNIQTETSTKIFTATVDNDDEDHDEYSHPDATKYPNAQNKTFAVKCKEPLLSQAILEWLNASLKIKFLAASHLTCP